MLVGKPRELRSIPGDATVVRYRSHESAHAQLPVQPMTQRNSDQVQRPARTFLEQGRYFRASTSEKVPGHAD
jgi:hypothetical protein